MAEIRIEEKKRGAPWMLIILLLIAAAAIGWWLWSNRSSGEATTDGPDTATATAPAIAPALDSPATSGAATDTTIPGDTGSAAQRTP